MVAEIRHKSVAEEPVTSVLSPNEIPILEGEHGEDDDVLASLGYKCVLPDRA